MRDIAITTDEVIDYDTHSLYYETFFVKSFCRNVKKMKKC